TDADLPRMCHRPDATPRPTVAARQHAALPMVLGRSARHRGTSRAAERSPQLALVASVDLDGVVRSGAAVVLADAAGVIRHHAHIGDQATVPMTQLERQRIGMPVSRLVIGTDRTVVEDEVLAQAIVVAAIAGTFQHP